MVSHCLSVVCQKTVSRNWRRIELRAEPDLVDHAVPGVACVVDDDVDLAVAEVCGLLDERVDVFVVEHVSGDSECLAAALVDGVCDGFCLVCGAIVSYICLYVC